MADVASFHDDHVEDPCGEMCPHYVDPRWGDEPPALGGGPIESAVSPEGVRLRVMGALGDLLHAVDVVRRRSCKDLFESDKFTVEGVDFVRLVAAHDAIRAALPADLEDAWAEASKRRPLP